MELLKLRKIWYDLEVKGPRDPLLDGGPWLKSFVKISLKTLLHDLQLDYMYRQTKKLANDNLIHLINSKAK